MAKGKEVMRDGVRGHLVNVAPREGYQRFVPLHYEKDDDDKPKRGARGRRGR